MPNILIPLSAAASRGDQILNARSFEKQGFSYVIEEEQLTADSLRTAIQTVTQQKNSYLSAMRSSAQLDSVHTILELIDTAASRK